MAQGRKRLLSKDVADSLEDKARRHELMEVDDSQLGRFPAGLPSNENSDWLTGGIEVEFRAGMQPKFLSTESLLLEEIEAPFNAAFNLLKEFLLQRSPFIRVNLSLDSVAAAGRFVTFHLPEEINVESLSEQLREFPQVRRAIPVPKSAPPSTPLDEPFVTRTDELVKIKGIENQWYLPRCGVDRAWDQFKVSGNGVIIADLDWGFRISHQELVARISLTYNSINNSSRVSEGNIESISHGTAVLGLAGADDNGLGMAGIAFGATFWAIRAEDGLQEAAPKSWVDAINFVRTTDSGELRKVIILEVQTSKGGNYEMVPSVNQAIIEAISDDIVVCVAAGNGNLDAGIDHQGNPISETGSILVGATMYHPTENRRASFSNWGGRVVVSAPGDLEHDVTCSSRVDFGYRNKFGGTSGATPKVAGTIALMLEANPLLTHHQIKEILRKTGTPVITEVSKPVGTFLNAERAVLEAKTLAKKV